MIRILKSQNVLNINKNNLFIGSVEIKCNGRVFINSNDKYYWRLTEAIRDLMRLNSK